MPANHLEQLVAEHYELQGYFVRRNVLVGRRPKGGYECELDVVAFHPTEQRLIHIECSGDALSWAKREERFKRKFAAGEKYIPGLFNGQRIPDRIEKRALLTFGSGRSRGTLGGADLVPLPVFLREVVHGLKGRSLQASAVSENMPLVRTIQMMKDHFDLS